MTPLADSNNFGSDRRALLAVVVIVKVAVATLVPLIEIEDGTLQDGLVVVDPLPPETAQESEIAPVNPLTGVTVMVAVLPVVAPGATLMFPLPVRLKPAAPAGAVTITFATVLALILPVAASVPLTVTA